MSNITHSIATLRETLGRLAAFEPDGNPVVSAYLDLRPDSTQDPRVRTGQVVLRDTLRNALSEQSPRTEAHKSLSIDAERMEHHVAEDLLPSTSGAAVFACAARDLFESVATVEALDDAVSVDSHPHILRLARLADHDPALVALADTNTLRLFALRSGALVELGVIDEDPAYKRTEAGGWSQARYQRHVDEHRDEFARLTAAAIEDNLAAEGAEVVVLAGDEVALPPLRRALPKNVDAVVRREIRLDMRSSLDDVNEICMPVLDELRSRDRRDLADRLMGAADSDGMGVLGTNAVQSALDLGQAMELVLEEDVADAIDRATAEDMVRRAVATGAPVRFVPDDAGLSQRGGVGALLRFRIDRDVNEPPAEVGDRRPAVGATATSNRR